MITSPIDKGFDTDRNSALIVTKQIIIIKKNISENSLLKY
jgi:hypothetical protein